MNYLLAILLFSGCAMRCLDVGQRTCDGFLCLHAVCNGDPLTKDEVKSKVNSDLDYQFPYFGEDHRDNSKPPGDNTYIGKGVN